ncbi:MAG: hypothetical protein ACRDZX_17005 [Acidimicrobiales bacterium]
MQDRYGAIAPGQAPDLVVPDLVVPDDDSRVVRVMAGGRWE